MRKIAEYGRELDIKMSAITNGYDLEAFLDTLTESNFELAKWQTRTADLLEKCQSCPYCFICRGGCAGRARFHHGTWQREYCGVNKEIFDFIASRIVGKHWQETHEEEMSLSLAGVLARLSQKEREIFMTSTNQKEIFELAKETGIFPGEFKENGK